MEDVLKESGAEPLRVYSILFEENFAGRIAYVEVGPLGDPVSVSAKVLCRRLWT